MGPGVLSAGDYVIVAISLVVVFGIGLYSTLQKRKGTESVGFFLAGRSMPWWIVAASLFASNIGTEHFVGQAGAAAAGGIAVGLYEWTAGYLLLVLGWVFAPVYLKCQLTSIPEYLEGRYNKHCRFLFVVITMLAYILSKIGASLYAGAILVKVVTGLNLWASAPIIIVATALYTVSGGLTAVMLTDTVQMVIFVFGGLVGTLVSLKLVGGVSGLFSIFRKTDLDYMTHLIHPLNDRDFPWLGMLVGQPFSSLWYWCIDQEMAQRVLSAKNLDHAQIGAATAGFFKILPVFITVIPGMVARALFELCESDGSFPEWCADKTRPLSDDNAANEAYPLLVVRQFPVGVKGIMVASFLAAMMSSLSSVFNSASTVFTYDVYQRFWYPNGDAPPHKLVLVGRGTTVALTLVTFLWLPMIDNSSRGLYLVAQNAMTHLAPALVSIFLLALFWRRANGEGAFSGFVLGSLLGIMRWIFTLVTETECDALVKSGPQGQIQKLTASTWLACMNFNHFSMILLAFTTVVVIIVSLKTEPPSQSQLEGRMFGNLGSRKKGYTQPASNSPRTSDAEQTNPTPYNPFADTAKVEGNRHHEDQEKESPSFGVAGVESTEPQDVDLTDLRPFTWIEKYGKTVANCLAVALFLSMTVLITIFH
ncbi:hypothetical protein BSKO_08975 [Bryopsis sp. KO-2023]|nr:hypothetical protein BSKO_08975 [Bryopsis sp. KO-2023]